MEYYRHRFFSGRKIRVSRLCFGSLCIGPLQSDMSAAQGGGIILHALERGVNFIDTAQLYGTYGHIRHALDRFHGEVVISTKTYAYSVADAKAAHHEAEELLGRKYTDIFLLHEQESIHTLRGHEEALDYLFSQRRAGNIGAVGLSTHHIDGVAGAVLWNRAQIAAGRHDRLIDVVHPIYNKNALGILLNSPDEVYALTGASHKADRLALMSAAIKAAAESGIFVFGMKALGGGNLFGEAEQSLSFVLADKNVGSVAVGMKTTAEVEADISFFSGGGFRGYKPDRAKKKLHIESWCEGCGKCAARCRQGAISAGSGIAECDPQKCVLCGYCSSACECFAIKIT